MISIPQLVALALQADGWWLRSEITWCKKAPMPESVTDRPTNATEKVFLLAKSAKYWYDAEAVKEPSAMKPQNRFTNGRGMKDEGYADHRKAPGMTAPSNRNLWNYWLLNPDAYSGAHFATMPRKLAEICILAGCPAQACPTCGKGWERVVETNRVKHSHTPGKGGRQNTPGSETSQSSCFRTGLVPVSRTLGHRPACTCLPADPVPGVTLDPFGGSGTTGQVASRLGRKAILIELNPEYLPLVNQRTAQAGLNL